jgi:hypothetical protein
MAHRVCRGVLPCAQPGELPAESVHRQGRGGGVRTHLGRGDGAIAPLGPEPESKARYLNFNRLASFIDEKGIGGAQIFRNRLRLREGPGAIDAEHLGGLSHGIHQTLLDSTPPDGEHGEPLLRLFHTWPRDWDAEFILRARGAFVVSSALKAGQVGFVEILSEAGAQCRLENPWGEAAVELTRDGQAAGILNGVRLSFPTRTGERIHLRRRP